MVLFNKRDVLLFNRKARLTRRHVFLLNKTMSSCSKRRHALLFSENTCLLVRLEDMYSCWTRRHVSLFNNYNNVELEDVPSCRTRRHGFLLSKKTILIVEPQDMSSCWTRRRAFLFNKNPLNNPTQLLWNRTLTIKGCPERQLNFWNTNTQFWAH